MARVWATSYGLYNQGRLIGKWYDLTDFDCKDDFIEAVQADLAPYDDDPEILFCDWEDIPRTMISESSIDDEVWDWISLDEDDQQLLLVYRDHCMGGADIDDAREAFQGRFRSEADWAEDFWESTGMISEIPEHARNYIDFEAFARDARCGGDVTFVDGPDHKVWVFRAC